MIKKKIKIMIDKIYYNGENEREGLLKNLIKSLYEITLDDVNKLMDSLNILKYLLLMKKLMILKIIIKKHINLVNKINDMFFCC